VAGTDLFHVDLLNELWSAYSERRLALGIAAATAWAIGQDVQPQSTWAGIQTWIETNSTSFVDHAQAVSGHYNNFADIPMFTLATFRAAAGLNAAGFRRSTSTGATAYGIMQVGDEIGPWVFQELQAALSALKWTFAGACMSPEEQYSTVQVSGEPAVSSCTDVLSALASLEMPDWVGGGIAYIAAAAVWYYEPGMQWHGAAWRGRRRVNLTVPTFVPVEVDVHFKLTVPGSVGIGVFKSIDKPSVGEDHLCFHETWSALDPPVAVRGGEDEAAWFGNYTDNPTAAASLFCESSLSAGAETSYPAESFVFKWSFSRSN